MARVVVPARLSPEGKQKLLELAAQETGGNVSDIVRRLLSEALTARARQGR